MNQGGVAKEGVQNAGSSNLLATPDASYGGSKFSNFSSDSKDTRGYLEDQGTLEIPLMEPKPVGCFKRWFPNGLLPHGSMLASGFNLASATLGAGALSLPSAM